MYPPCIFEMLGLSSVRLLVKMLLANLKHGHTILMQLRLCHDVLDEKNVLIQLYFHESLNCSKCGGSKQKWCKLLNMSLRLEDMADLLLATSDLVWCDCGI
ncbi:hypothetical protein Droror1_Dr00019240 [Drosera rotundifolia]